jgi:hypothetical protein
MHAGDRAYGRPTEHGRGSTRADDWRRAPGILSLKRSEKAKQLLLKRTTEEQLSEKTVDARASDEAVDEDDPVRMNSSQRHYQPHGGRQMYQRERAYATGWLKFGLMDTVGSGGGKTR